MTSSSTYRQFKRSEYSWWRAAASAFVAFVVSVAAVPAQPSGGPVGSTYVEFETLAASAAVSAGEAVVQPMAGFGSGWGNDAQLFWRPPAPVEEPMRNYPHLSLLVDVPAAAEYELTLHYTQAPDYGKFTVFVAGAKTADVDGYGDRVQTARRSLGKHRLDAGSTQLTFTIFGKNSASTGYIVGLDRLELQTAATTVSPSARPMAGKVALDPAGRAVQPRANLVDTGMLTALAQPKLEVYHEQLGFDSRGVRLDWNSPVLRPRFRWQAEATGAKAAVWEISTTPFPGNPGVRPDGLLAGGRTELSAGASTAEFEIDLAPHKPGRGRLQIPGKPKPDPGIERPYVFVRLRTVDAAGEFVGRPSEPISLFFGKPGKLKIPKRDDNVPRLRLVSYRPPRPYTFDFQCRGRATQDLYMMGTKVIAKGQSGDLCKKKSKDFFDHFEDAVGSVVDLVSGAVDWAATAYNDIKATAMGAVVDGLKASGVGCGGECQFVVGAAIDAGLAAAGMPPSLPEFDQLVADLQQDGIDALAGTVAEAAASQGVPEAVAHEAAKRAAEELVKKAKQTAAAGASGGRGIWMIDPAGLYSPAVIVVEATNLDATRQSEPAYAKLDSVFAGHWGTFRFTGAKIPPLEPKRSLLLSFELEPMQWEAGWMDYLPQGNDCAHAGGVSKFVQCITGKRGEAKAELAKWTELYTGHEHRFRLSTVVDGGAHDVAELTCAGSQTLCDVHFSEPAWRGQRIDTCYEWGKGCGQPAAQAFCERMGYRDATHFERADNIGEKTPTKTLGDGKTCSHGDCDGFATITCSNTVVAGVVQP